LNFLLIIGFFLSPFPPTKHYIDYGKLTNFVLQ